MQKLQTKSQNMKICYSCVVDTHEKFQKQAWIWAKSLVNFARVLPSHIWIHCIVGTNETFIEKVLQAGFNIEVIERFGDGKYCNKIGQLSTNALLEFDLVVLMDADMIVMDNFMENIDDDVISGKIVDLPNPDISCLDEIFDNANLSSIYLKRQVSAQNNYTYYGNLNGGLYILPSSKIKTLKQSWEKWANWLLETKHLHKSKKGNHVDQVSFCMAIHENKFEVKHLSLDYNFPLHIQIEEAVNPKVLHYHWLLNESEKIVPEVSMSSDVNKAVLRANDFLSDLYNDENIFKKESLLESFKSKCPNVVGKKVFFHIGMPKTGTTAIQNYLVKHFNQCSSSETLYYTSDFLEKQQELVRAMIDYDWLRFLSYWEKASKYGVGKSQIVISVEGFYNHVNDFNESSWLFLKVLREVVDLQILLYIRPQDAFFESYYKQNIINPKTGDERYATTLKRKDYIKLDSISRTLNYEGVVSQYANVVGENNVSVKLYSQNVVKEFVEGIGEAFEGNSKVKNHSLSVRDVEIMRQVNDKFSEKQREILVKILKDTPYDFTPDFRIEEHIDTIQCNELIEKYSNRSTLGDGLLGKSVEVSQSLRPKGLITKLHEYYIIKKSALFDEQYYKENNPDISGNEINPLWHYVCHGASELRNPSEFFDSIAYVEHFANTNVNISNPLVHYIKNEKK